MKKITIFILAILMMFSIASCGNKEKDTEKNTDLPKDSVYFIYNAENETYTEYTDSGFPTTIGNKDKFVCGDYEYVYSQGKNGWEVIEVKDKTKTSYGEILKTVNGIKIVSLRGTFKNCANLIEAPEIPETVTIISSAFINCASMEKTPYIPDGVTNLLNTFAGCTNLKQVTNLPKSATSMIQTFMNCKNIISVPEIPEGVKALNRAFENCISLKITPNIPDKVEEMKSIFSGCIALENAPKIPKNVKNLESAFTNCSSMSGTISIPCTAVTSEDTTSRTSLTLEIYHYEGCGH